MNEKVWQLDEFIELFKENAALVILAVLFFALLAVIVCGYLPTRYRAQAMLSIQSSYFQNPLVKEMIAEEVELDELRSQRYALLRMALTPEFVDKLGEKYGIYRYPAEHSRRGIEREQLFENIEYYTEGPAAVASGAFQIRVAAETGELAYRLTEEVLQQMLKVLFEQRHSKLVHTRQSIEKQLVLLGQFLKENSEASGSPVARGQQALNSELRRVQSELSGLLRHYTDRHPVVVKKQLQLDALQKQVGRFDSDQSKGEASNGDETSVVLSSSAAQGRLQEVYNDLITKLSNLDVVIRIESKRGDFPHVSIIEQPTLPLKPEFPSKRIFAGLGGVFGLFFSGIIVLFRSVKRAELLLPESVPSALGLPFLGELPSFSSGERQLFLSNANKNGSAKSLPEIEQIIDSKR